MRKKEGKKEFRQRNSHEILKARGEGAFRSAQSAAAWQHRGQGHHGWGGMGWGGGYTGVGTVDSRGSTRETSGWGFAPVLVGCVPLSVWRQGVLSDKS
eukprot:755723-Hanusia_phi.AAC.3